MSKSGVKPMRAIGLMSGTSMDAIDVAMIETDGEDHVVRGPALTLPYNSGDRRLLSRAMDAAKACTRRDERPKALAIAEEMVTRLHGAAVLAFLTQYSVERSKVAVIGFHGQTVLHRQFQQVFEQTDDKVGAPENVRRHRKTMLTIQLGDGQKLADETGIPVVFDLRAADTEAGGQGAPLVPIYHKALVARLPQRPVAVVNIGGVANVTWIEEWGRYPEARGGLIAFDTGPGNATIDDWMGRHTDLSFDDAGSMAARGRVNVVALKSLISHPYFSKCPPKSIDRNEFDLDELSDMSAEDGAATLTAFTAEAIAKSREHLPDEPALWIICGGGRKNKTLMSMLAGRVENAVVPCEAVGLDGDMIEAEAWAYLAVRSLRGLPITFRGTTGVAKPTTGGVHGTPRT